MKLILTALPASLLAAGILVALAPIAQSQSEADETVRLCLEAVTDLSGGTPPQEAVQLCQEGKVEDAINVAATGG